MTNISMTLNTLEWGKQGHQMILTLNVMVGAYPLPPSPPPYAHRLVFPCLPLLVRLSPTSGPVFSTSSSFTELSVIHHLSLSVSLAFLLLNFLLLFRPSLSHLFRGPRRQPPLSGPPVSSSPFQINAADGNSCYDADILTLLCFLPSSFSQWCFNRARYGNR